MLEDLFALNGPYAKFMNWLWNMILISVLWLFCSVPVITFGAASTAAYYTAAKCVRHNTGSVIVEFFRSFRINFRQAVVLMCIHGAVLCLIILECIYLYQQSAVPLAVLYLFYFLALMIMAFAIYLWPCLSRFCDSIFGFLKMAVVLVFRHIPTTILLLLLHLGFAIAIYLMPWGILLFPGMMIYLQTFLMEKILRRLSPEPIHEEEARKWYYQ